MKVWDPRQKDKPVAVMQSADEIVRECWAVAFGKFPLELGFRA